MNNSNLIPSISGCLISLNPLPLDFIYYLFTICNEVSINFSKQPSKDYTDKLYQSWGKKIKISINPFHNFAEARNISIEKSTGEWIFVLDTDEKLSEQLKKKIPELVKNPNYDVYCFKRIHFVNDPPPINDYWNHLRLFKRKCRYFGTIHEQVVNYSNKIVVNEAGCYILHDNYREDEYHKGIQRLAQLKEDIQKAKKLGNNDLIRYFQYKAWVQENIYLKEYDRKMTQTDFKQLYERYEEKSKEIEDLDNKIVKGEISMSL